MSLRETFLPSTLRSSRTFRRLWLVGVCLQLAGGLRQIALPWLVLVETGSPLQLGITLAVGSLDTLTAPVVGPLIDRLPERQVVVAGIVGYGATLLALPAAAAVEQLRLPVIYAVVAALGFTQFAYHNARHSWVPRLVEDLDAANALVHGTGVAARVGFLLVGGVVTSVASPLAALVVAGVVALAGVTPLVGVTNRERESSDVAGDDSSDAASDDSSDAAGDAPDVSGDRESAADGHETLWETLRAGVSALRHRTLATLVVVSVGVNAVAPAYGLLFAAAGDRLFGAALAYTALLAARETGKLGGNWLVPRLDWPRETAVHRGVTLSGVATLLLGVVGSVAGGRLVSLAVVCVFAAVAGATQPVFNIPSDSLVQTLVPERHRGTVLTVTNALYQLPFPLAYLGGGWVAERLSPFVGFGLAGAALVVLGAGARVAFATGTGGGD